MSSNRHFLHLYGAYFFLTDEDLERMDRYLGERPELHKEEYLNDLMILTRYPSMKEDERICLEQAIWMIKNEAERDRYLKLIKELKAEEDRRK